MTFKSLFLRTVVFLIGLVALLTLATRLLVPKNNDREYGLDTRRANGILGEMPESVEILVLGNSRVYTALVPMEIWGRTGYTSYICGTPGQELYDSMLYANKALSQQSPRLVFLEADTVFSPASMTRYAFSRIKEYLPILQYHNRWKSLLPEDFSLKDPEYTWTDEDKGYVYTLEINGTDPTRDYMSLNSQTAAISRANLLSIRSIKETCDEIGSELVLLAVPNYAAWSTGRHEACVALAAELGIKFLDLNIGQNGRLVDWSRDTRDKGEHLNFYGAGKVTAALIKYIQENWELEDRRGDPGYSAWAQDYKTYLIKTAAEE